MTEYVTLVAQGGTPVRISKPNGAPYPTTGTGALVFADSPTITLPNLSFPVIKQLIETGIDAPLAGGIALIDLSAATVQRLTLTQDVTSFDIQGLPTDGVTSFSLKTIGTGVVVSVNFNSIPVTWPYGGVPIPTTTINKRDWYSFTYDSGEWFGFVQGTNF